MKYLDFYHHFASNWASPVVSINDIKNVFPDFNNVQISQWQKKNYLQRVRKNQYLLSKQPQDIALLAHDLKKSYLSLEYALSYHGWIPEAVFQVTAITTARSENVATPLGMIVYHQIKPSLFAGYELLPSADYPGRFLAMASPEKALFDLVYLRHDLANENDFRSLRLSIESFKKRKFQAFVKLVKHKGRKARLLSLLSFIEKEFLRN